MPANAGRISTRTAAVGGARGAVYAPLRCDRLCAPSLPSTLVGVAVDREGHATDR